MTSSGKSRGTGFIAATLTWAMVAGGLARSGLPVMAPFVLEDLGISIGQLGLAMTAMTGAVALAVPAMGKLTDDVGPRTVLLLRALGTGTGLCIVATVPSFGWLILAQVLVGLVVAGGVPSSNAAIVLHVDEPLRGRVIGVKQSGGTLGSLLAGALLPPIALVAGWRLGVVAAGVVAMSAALLLLRFIPADPARNDPAGRTSTTSLRSVSQSLRVRWLMAHGALSGAGVAMVFSFVPLYATQELDFSPAMAGLALSVMAMVAVGARVGWGWFADARGMLGRHLRTISLVAVAAVTLLAAAPDLGPLALWGGAVLAGLSMEAWNALGAVGAVTSVSSEAAGTSSSLVQLGFMSGSAVGPAAFAMIIERTGTFRTGWLLCLSLFLVASVMRLEDPQPAERTTSIQ